MSSRCPTPHLSATCDSTNIHLEISSLQAFGNTMGQWVLDPMFHLFFPTSLWGSCFLGCIPPSAVRRPSSAAPPVDLISSPTILHPLLISHTQLISHNNSSHTQLISHTQLVSHNSSHTTHLTHNSHHNSSHTQLIAHATHLTQLISHNSSHTTHLTQFISHHSSHTTHLTPLISHHSSHTTHLTQLISHATHLRPLISHTSSHRRVAWQAQCAELPEGAAARIVAAVAAARFCLAGAVRRAS